MKILLPFVLFVLAGFIAASGGIAAGYGEGGKSLYTAVSRQVDMGTTETAGSKARITVSNRESSAKENASDRLEVITGQEFSITLASNATTGYHWELASPLDEAMVQLVATEYKTPETRLVGVGGQEIWTFRAVGRGQTVIKLKYVRPWEKDVAPVKTASYMVIVH
jgi:inhibitor of cysteine peptidase